MNLICFTISYSLTDGLHFNKQFSKSIFCIGFSERVEFLNCNKVKSSESVSSLLQGTYFYPYFLKFLADWHLRKGSKETSSLNRYSMFQNKNQIFFKNIFYIDTYIFI